MNKQSNQFWSNAFSRISDSAWICLIALAPLIVLTVPGREYGVDWQSHRWFAGYFAEYFKQHHAFPDVINTEELSGMPIPIFYGFLLYPVLGLISVVTGSAVALRMV